MWAPVALGVRSRGTLGDIDPLIGFPLERPTVGLDWVLVEDFSLSLSYHHKELSYIIWFPLLLW